ncbi:MAG: hypothetical protein ACR2P5_02300 [Gammaproteobacteria bacterium]
MFEGERIAVLDCEIEHSPDDLATGWSNKAALGLSVGAYHDYRTGSVTVFDRAGIVATMAHFLIPDYLIVSFNGISFDGPLMRGIVRREAAADGSLNPLERGNREHICDSFKALMAGSYDILAEIWRADPDSKFVKGLNGLDAILKANDLPPKTGDGALAPKLWQEGKRDEVIQYCKDDVERTRQLFELVCKHQGLVRRTGGRDVFIPYLNDNLDLVGPQSQAEQLPLVPPPPYEGDDIPL